MILGVVSGGPGWIDTIMRDPATEILGDAMLGGRLSALEDRAVRCVFAPLYAAAAQLDPTRVQEGRLAEVLYEQIAPIVPYAAPPDHPLRPDVPDGQALADRVDEITARITPGMSEWTARDLDRAIGDMLAVAAGFPPFRPDHLAAMRCLSVLSRARFQRAGNEQDAVVAADAAAQIVAAQEPGCDAWAEGLSLYAGAVTARALATTGTDDLDEVITVLERLVAATDDPRQAKHLYAALSGAYGAKLELDGDDPTLLTRAVAAATRAAGGGADNDDPGDGNSGNGVLPLNLAALKGRQAIVNPDDATINKAVEQARTAVSRAAAAADRATRAMSLSNLSYVLRVRYEHRSEPHDLVESITTARQAVDLLPADDPHRVGCQVNLLAALSRRALAQPTAEHCDAAVEAGRRALADLAPGHPLRYKLQGAYGNALLARHLFGRDEADTRAGLAAFRAALDEVVGDRGQEAVLEASRCNAARLVALARIADDDPEGADEFLAEAYAAGERARELVPADDPRWVLGTFNLAAAYLGDTRDEAVLLGNIDRALELLSAVAEQPTASPGHRMEAAHQVAEVGAMVGGRGELVSRAYAICVEQLAELAFLGLTRDRQEELLSRWPVLVQDAAGWALNRERPEEAMSILERGRAILWSQTIDLRSPLDLLADEHPALGAEIRRLRAVLDATAAEVEAPFTTDGHSSSLVDARMRAAARWAELRRDHRVAALLAPPDLDGLRARLTDESVIYLSSGAHGCHGLLVNRDDFRSFHLRGLDPAEVAARARDLLRVLDSFTGRPTGFGAVLADHLTGLLPWLWDQVVGLIARTLGSSNSAQRVVWCPTGPFAALPLHAAGHYERDGPVPGKNALERMVGSYTSTVRALVANPADAPGSGRDGSGLLVVEHGLPTSTGRDDPAAVVEALGITGDPTPLTGADATVEAVTAALARHSRVHFACHGRQVLDSPSRAALMLADGPLRLPRIPTGSGREFAFLAACSTSTGGRRLPNEVLTMSAAFQYAGWKRVVGTLWPVSNAVATELTRQFYAGWGGPGMADTSTAVALRDVVLAACRRAPHRPDRWAGYVHIGPTK